MFSPDLAGLNLNQVLVIEVFAGTARLSSAVRDAGMGSLAIDKETIRSSKSRIAVYDLTEPDQVNALKQPFGLRKHRIVWVHCAPACGTASRARERPLKNLAAQGFKVPQPSRSESKPLGADGLSGVDKLRTETANISYSNTADLCLFCRNLGIAISIENPIRSLFWNVPDIVQLLKHISGWETIFDNCCHGGTRPKTTLWWSNRNWFQALSMRCDGNHYHDKWNPQQVEGKLRLPTHDEAAYPILLCHCLAEIVRCKAVELGAQVQTELDKQIRAEHTTSHRLVLNMLPKGKTFRPLVSEFGSYWKAAIPLNSPSALQDVLNNKPKGAKVLHRLLQHWGKQRVDEKAENWADTIDVFHIDLRRMNVAEIEVVTIGVPREPEDVLERAIKAGHPRSVAIHLSERLKTVSERTFLGSPTSWSRTGQNFCGSGVSVQRNLQIAR